MIGVLAGGLASMLLVGLWQLGERAQPEPDRATAASVAHDSRPPHTLRLRWRSEERHAWRVAYEGASTTRLDAIFPGQERAALPLEGSFALDAALHLQVASVDPGGGAVLRVWIADVTHASLVLGEAPDPGRDALAVAFADAALDLHVDDCGRILGLREVEPGAAGTAILRSVIDASWPVVCGDADREGWTVHRELPQGRVEDHLVSLQGPGHGVRLASRTYHQFALAPEAVPLRPAWADLQTRVEHGMWVEHRVEERLHVASDGGSVLEATMRATYRSIDIRPDAVAPRRAAAGAWSSPGPRAAGDPADLLRARAEGLDAQTLLETLAASGTTGLVPDHNRFLWQAPARLALEPDLLDDVVALAIDEGTEPAGRALMLDLIAQTPSPRAGVALARALADETLRSERAWPLLLQRSGFVAEPPSELIELVESLALTSESPNERTAARYALGSLAASLDALERSSEADRLYAHLISWERSASLPDERIHAMRALANTERASVAERLLAVADDPMPRVRAAAASSLASFPTRAATDRLVTLVGDSDMRVQRESIGALRAHDLAPAHLEGLARHLQEARMHEENATALLDLAKYYVEMHPERVREIARLVNADARSADVVAASNELARRTGRMP